MLIMLPRPDPSESRLKPRAHRRSAAAAAIAFEDLTPAERAAATCAYAGELVALRLLRDKDFQAAVATDAPADVAKRYCPRPGQGRAAIRCLAQWSAAARELYPANPVAVVEARVSGWFAWTDEPVDKASRLRLAEVERGAEILARYGARRCIHLNDLGDPDCGVQIARDRAGQRLCEPHDRAAAGSNASVRAADERRIMRSRARALEALGRRTRRQRAEIPREQ